MGIAASTLVFIQILTSFLIAFSLLQTDEVLHEFEKATQEGTKTASAFVVDGKLQPQMIEPWTKVLATQAPGSNSGFIDFSNNGLMIDIYVEDLAGNRLAKSWVNANRTLTSAEKNALGLARQGILTAKRVDGRIITQGVVKFQDKPIAYVVVASQPIFTNSWIFSKLFSRLLPQCFLILFTTAAIGSFVAYTYAHSTRKRLEEIKRVLAEWGMGNLETTIRIQPRDEFSELADRLNAMSLELKRTVSLQTEVGAQEERTRMIRDLHDGVKQGVFALNLLLSSTDQHLASDNKILAASSLKKALGQCENIQVELQAMLTPSVNQISGMSATERIRLLIQDWQQASGRAIHLEMCREDLKWDGPSVESAVRIIGEALSNAVRHSQCRNIRVLILPSAIEITDDGIGFAPDLIVTHGLGLASMRARATSLPSGSLQINSGSTGSTIQVSWEAR
jgi:signal transduction histidine kinase